MNDKLTTDKRKFVCVLPEQRERERDLANPTELIIQNWKKNLQRLLNISSLLCIHILNGGSITILI